MLDEPNPLSERELEIVGLLATGATNQQIAQELVISVNTVKVHLRNIYAKLEVSSRTEATMVAVRRGWVGMAGGTAPEDTPPQDGAAASDTAVDRPAIHPQTTIRQLPERWPRVSAVKRVSLMMAVLLAVLAVSLPRVVSLSRASGQVSDPIKGVFPTATAPAGASAGRWQTHAQMPTPRNGLAVISQGNSIFAIGGVGNSGVSGRVEVYDPEIDTWTAGSPKPTPVGFVSAVSLGGKIYVPGGVGEQQEVQAVLEIYDPEADDWESGAAMPQALAAYALAASGGDLYLFGGQDQSGPVDSVYRYDPSTDSWDARRPMEKARGFLSASAVNGVIYVAGGYDGESELDTCHAYDPSDDTWTTLSPMALPRGGLALVAVRGTLYAIGGGMNSYLAFNERYDPRTDAWSRIDTPVTGQWRGLGSAYVEPSIYAIGGWNGRNLSANEAYQALFVILVP